MTSKDIVGLREHGRYTFFVYKDKSVKVANGFELDLYKEIQILRQYGNKDCTAQADEALEQYCLFKGD